jgi:hypothetical protein
MVMGGLVFGLSLGICLIFLRLLTYFACTPQKCSIHGADYAIYLALVYALGLIRARILNGSDVEMDLTEH